MPDVTVEVKHTGVQSLDNEILLDSYTGTDDERLTKALDECKASSPRRPIRLSARNHTFSLTRTTFSGLRILGPNVGWQNPEIAGSAGALPQCVVTLNCGIGASSWLVGTATTYDVTIAGICFKSDTGAQFYHHPYSAGTSYATRLHELTFYGFKHVLGMPGNAFAMTLNTLSGTWTCVGVRGTQFSLRGSDNFLWKNGEINYGWWGENGGQYLVRFENLMKTSVANMYLTARDGARAVLVDAPAAGNQGGLDISDCVIEGNNKDQPAYGALIVVKGGGVSFTNTKLNFGMRDPSRFTDQTDTALVMVLGGLAVFTNTWTCRAELMAATVPIFDVRAGATAHVDRVLAMQGYTMGQQLPAKVAAATTTTPAGRLMTDASLKAA